MSFVILSLPNQLVMRTSEMNDYEKMEQHWHILRLNHQMIRYSEVKAGMVITLFSILITLAFKGENLMEEEIANSIILKILLSAAAITVAISFYYAVKAFYPRFFDKNPKSVIYYGDVATEFSDYNEYQKELLSCSENINSMSSQVAEQIHTLSNIAKAKFRNVSQAVKFFIISIAILFISLLTSVFV